MATQADLAVELAALTPQVQAIGAGITTLNQKVAALEAQLAEAGNVTPEVQAAVDALKMEIANTAALLPVAEPPPVEPPPAEEPPPA